MDARKKAAAVSAAGMLLIAGCGGKGGGGVSLPATPGGTHQIAIPANSSKIAMRFSAPMRKIAGWPTPRHILPAPAGKARKMPAKYARRSTASAVRTPKYIPPAVVGGSVVISIYQNGTSAFPNQTFAVGTSLTSPISCTQIYSNYAYAYQCSSNPPYGNVYAPLGADTFYVAMYDSQNRLLAITPGLAGFSGGVAATPYTVTASGGTIYAYTYAVASTVGIETANSCLTPTFGGWGADVEFFDAGGNPISGPLANPITLTTNNLGLYGFYGGLLAATYTVYDTSVDFWNIAPNADGASGSISTNAVPINKGASSLNIYAVDRYAIAPVAGGTLSMLGLYDGGPTTFACGALVLGAYDTGAPITFANPRGIVSNDTVGPLVAVVDVASSTIVDAIDLAQYDFGAAGTYPYAFDAAVPVAQIAFAGTNPLDETISGNDSKIYVLDSSGNVEAIDYSNFFPFSASGISNVAGAGTFSSGTSTPSSFGTFVNPVDFTDSLIVGDNSAPSIHEVDEVPSAPVSGSLLNLSLLGLGLDSATRTTAVYTDPTTGHVMVRAFDSANSKIFDCNTSPIGTYITQNYFNALDICTFYGQLAVEIGVGSMAAVSGGPGSIGLGPSGTVFVSTGTGLQQVTEGIPPSVTATFPSIPGTRIASAYDTAWTGLVNGTTIDVFSQSSLPTATSLGALAGSYLTIVSPPNVPL
ncbi:MAG: hypothetical protein ACRENA_09025 [Vulcanimicrobiaceae bacterium]